MNILVVEPHADDAFLSMGWHLRCLWRRHNRTLLTVFIDSLARAPESARYARMIGASHKSLNILGEKLDSQKCPAEVPRLVPHLTDPHWDRVVVPLGLQ